MENNVELSHGQAAFLTFATSMGGIIYTFTMVTLVTGRPFWVAVFIGVLLNIPLALWILVLGSYRKKGTLFDLLEDGLGKVICRVVIFIYYFINILISISMVNLFAGTAKVFFLQRTPSAVIIVFLMIICVIITSGGMKYLGRFVSILSFLAIVNYFAGMSVSFVRDFHVEFITPVFDTTLAKFTKGIMITAGSNAECLLFLMVMVGSINYTKKYYLSVVKGLFAWSLVLSIAILLMEGIVSDQLLARVAQAGITVGSTIQIGSFIRGLEIFILMTYQYITVYKTCLSLYICWISAKKIFNVPKGRPLLVLSAVLVATAAAWINSYNAGYFLSVFLGSYITLPFVIFVLLLCTVSVLIIKNKNGNEEK